MPCSHCRADVGHIFADKNGGANTLGNIYMQEHGFNNVISNFHDELNAALVADAPASSVDVLGALLQRAQARWRDVDVTLESRVFGSRTEARSSQPDSEL